MVAYIIRFFLFSHDLGRLSHVRLFTCHAIPSHARPPHFLPHLTHMIAVPICILGSGYTVIYTCSDIPLDKRCYIGVFSTGFLGTFCYSSIPVIGMTGWGPMEKDTMVNEIAGLFLVFNDDCMASFLMGYLNTQKFLRFSAKPRFLFRC